MLSSCLPANEMQSTSQISISLGDREVMPADIIKRIVLYLDVGHIVSLSQVNQFLRGLLVGWRDLWLQRLQYGLKVDITRKTRANPYKAIMDRVHTHRCSDCGIMEVYQQRPFFHSFFNVVLCGSCKNRTIYALITATTAKRNYFLNEDDLLPLRTISLENPHYPRASPVRLYSRHRIREISQKKLAIQGMTRDQRIRLKELRSKRATIAKRRAVATRSRALMREMKAHGLMTGGIDSCAVAKSFISGGWKDYRRRSRWTVEDIIEHIDNERDGRCSLLHRYG
jgi:hypothetical protein